jgi:ribosomal protein S18 acetylase RimI-like enzyme
MMADMESDPAHHIRPARPGEAGAIRGLVRRAYAMYVPRMGKEPGPMLDDYEKRVADGAAFVLEVEGTIAGILVLLPYDDHLLMDNVAVDNDFQGRGIGKALVTFAEEEAVRRDYDEIRLYTHQTMVENVRMYAKLGYEETGRGEQAGYDRVFMRKVLRRNTG